MKFTLIALTTCSLLAGCQKTYENAVEEAVISAITTGTWKVSEYIKGDSNLTASFSEYKFAFGNNRTVDAIRGNSVEATGAWEENAVAKTIYANYSNAHSTLMMLNGTWNISKNSWTYVVASQTVNGQLRKLRLDKE